ncbi:MAG: putative Fe-S cluster assembly protein SufT [Deltaproteobacteria bacterium]|nr:putative Fe-S cluster assembly protein SufT [Deltaproteobacteria bacterium]
MMNHRSEEIELSREVQAVVIPAGDITVLPAGLRVRITQALGGTYTVITENGVLARVEAADSDALGITPAPKPADLGFDTLEESMVWDELRTCYDPEIPVNIVDLGLVYGCQISDHPEGGKRVLIQMTLTAPGCGMGDILKIDIERKISRLPEVKETLVEVVLDPPWSPAKMSESARLELGMM